MDVNVAHKFIPSRKGLCKQIVGGRKRGYSICGLPEDAIVHIKWKTIEKEEEEK